MTEEPVHLPRRRLFQAAIVGGVALGAAACTSSGDDDAAPTTTIPAPDLSGDPFMLGVASGDPLPDAVVLWTRLRTAAADVPDQDISVNWELATDESMTDVVRSGTAVATPRWGHAVHVDVDGLEPATRYWYRFSVGDADSAIGRTRTTAAQGEAPVRLAVCTCQGYESGYYTAYRYMADEDLDAVFFNGDFIYDFEAAGEIRPHGLGPPVSLEDYRALYEVGLGDPDLATNRAAHPWIVTWDDHEVEDNYAGLVPGELSQRSGTGAADFSERRAAAYQAWWEHQPVRSPEPDGPDLPIYRSFTFGDLVTMPVIDTRQYRDEQVKDGNYPGIEEITNYGDQTEAVFAEDLQMLGAEQEDWLLEEIDGTDRTWFLLGQQSIIGGWNLDPSSPTGKWSTDTWDGYVAQRRRVLDALSALTDVGVVATGGDLHHSVVQTLRADPTVPDSAALGSEFICPSVTATASESPEEIANIASAPYIQFYDATHRGYMVLGFTSDEVTAEMTWVDARVADAPMEPGPVYRATLSNPVPTSA